MKKTIILLNLFLFISLNNCLIPAKTPDAGKDTNEEDTNEEDTNNPQNCPDRMVKLANNNKFFCIDIYEYPDNYGATPETYLAFFQANNKCLDSGKRLCYLEEFEIACSGIDEVSCNGTGTISASGSYPQCVSTDGIYDLVGNVAEWSATGTISGGFWVVGGSFSDGYDGIGCGIKKDVQSYSQSLDIGFRCCKSL